MVAMVTRKRVSQAVLLVLLGVILAVSSHSLVEATTRANKQPSRRLSTTKIRGRDSETVSEGKVERVHDETKGEDKKSRTRPNLPEVFRRVPTKFNNIGLNPKPTKPSTLSEEKKPSNLSEEKKPSTSSEEKLPEVPQAMNIKVNQKKLGNSEKGGGLSSTPKGNGRIGIGIGKKNEKAKENGIEHFQEVDIEIYKRDVPSFSIQFNIEDSSSSNLPNLADYNELSLVSEEYLHNFFQSVFEDVLVRHTGTALFLMTSEDNAYTVDFQMTLEFIIPGEVPTINFLIDSLQKGLERDTSQAFFIADLSTMSKTNPFRNTVSFTVVSRPPASAAAMDRTGGSPQVGSIEQVGNNHILISLLAGMGCVVLVGTGLMWRKKKINRGAVSDSNPAFSLFDKSSKKDASFSSKTSGMYGADEETMNYLNSIRKRYRDNGDSKKPSSSASNDNNIAAMERSGSYDGEDSMCNTVDTGTDNENQGVEVVEDDLRSIY